LTPKFHWYKPQIAILTGIAWDHINVFPTFENYVDQFSIFIKSITSGGKLFWFEEDENLQKTSNLNNQISSIPYNTHEYFVDDTENICVKHQNKVYKMSVFGEHNLQNINAARYACLEAGVSETDFWENIQNFEGAAKRLQLVKENENSAFYLDFAHAPSKLRATIKALKQKYPNRKLIACMELHTFSSLQKNFIPHYKDCMKDADIAIVYYSHEVIKHKRLPEIEEEFVRESFGDSTIVFTDTNKLQEYLQEYNYHETNLLMMSSGNFNGVDFFEFSNKIIK
jgi:UDP-N-acetylmuramate: L-alanyl-gamma-D-glutamyl-meso-diaminopimelate ligase